MTHNTARSWIGVLEASFIAFRLEPFFKNFSKRIIKSPKLYFYDTGLLCRVLDIRNAKELETHPFRGAVLENWCVVEALKSFHNRGARPGIYFWRDQTMEVDLLLELSSTAVAAIECKSGITPPGDALKTPQALRSIMKGYEVVPKVIFGGETTQRRGDGILFGRKDFAKEMARPSVSLERFRLAKT